MSRQHMLALLNHGMHRKETIAMNSDIVLTSNYLPSKVIGQLCSDSLKGLGT
jgi:hypothetical protein